MKPRDLTALADPMATQRRVTRELRVAATLRSTKQADGEERWRSTTSEAEATYGTRSDAATAAKVAAHDAADVALAAVKAKEEPASKLAREKAHVSTKRAEEAVKSLLSRYPEVADAYRDHLSQMPATDPSLQGTTLELTRSAGALMATVTAVGTELGRLRVSSRRRRIYLRLALVGSFVVAIVGTFAGLTYLTSSGALAEAEQAAAASQWSRALGALDRMSPVFGQFGNAREIRSRSLTGLISTGGRQDALRRVEQILARDGADQEALRLEQMALDVGPFVPSHPVDDSGGHGDHVALRWWTLSVAADKQCARTFGLFASLIRPGTTGPAITVAPGSGSVLVKRSGTTCDGKEPLTSGPVTREVQFVDRSVGQSTIVVTVGGRVATWDLAGIGRRAEVGRVASSGTTEIVLNSITVLPDGYILIRETVRNHGSSSLDWNASEVSILQGGNELRPVALGRVTLGRFFQVDRGYPITAGTEREVYYLFMPPPDPTSGFTFVDGIGTVDVGPTQ